MSSIEGKQGFTIATATATLPLVSRIVEDLVSLSHDISDTQERLAFTVSDRDSRTNVYSNELRAVKIQMDKKSVRLESCIDELLELNTLTGNVSEGFVDFPACRSGQRICLCWELGEQSVTHWHGVDESCKQRRLVDLQLVQKSVERQLSSSNSVLKP